MRRIKQEAAEATMTATMFPIKAAFDKEMEKIEAKAILWRDLKVDEIYRIEEKREVPNMHNNCASPTPMETASKFGRLHLLPRD